MQVIDIAATKQLIIDLEGKIGFAQSARDTKADEVQDLADKVTAADQAVRNTTEALLAAGPEPVLDPAAQSVFNAAKAGLEKAQAAVPPVQADIDVAKDEFDAADKEMNRFLAAKKAFGELVQANADAKDDYDTKATAYHATSDRLGEIAGEITDLETKLAEAREDLAAAETERAAWQPPAPPAPPAKKSTNWRRIVLLAAALLVLVGIGLAGRSIYNSLRSDTDDDDATAVVTPAPTPAPAPVVPPVVAPPVVTPPAPPVVAADPNDPQSKPIGADGVIDSRAYAKAWDGKK